MDTLRKKARYECMETSIRKHQTQVAGAYIPQHKMHPPTRIVPDGLPAFKHRGDRLQENGESCSSTVLRSETREIGSLPLKHGQVAAGGREGAGEIQGGVVTRSFSPIRRASVYRATKELCGKEFLPNWCGTQMAEA